MSRDLVIQMALAALAVAGLLASATAWVMVVREVRARRAHRVPIPTEAGPPGVRAAREGRRYRGRHRSPTRREARRTHQGLAAFDAGVHIEGDLRP